ncbi:MAG: GldG family protein [Candidatus Brocadiales bacterium]
MSGSSSTVSQSGFRFARKAVIGANVFVMIVIAIVICGIVSYINNRHYHRFDCTASGRFSLTSKTKNILKGLEKPIVISTLFNRGDRFTEEIFQQVSDILAEYSYQSDKLKIDHIDPLREHTKVELLAKRISIEQIALNSVIFESEGKSKHSDIRELIERKFPFNFKGEEVFTAAIIAVSEKKQTGIFFTTGHGERSTEDFNLVGLSDIANALKRDNYGVISLDILSEKRIPDSCGILVIAGPTKSFSTEEANIIRNYLKDGKLLVMLEPALGRNKPSGLKGLLREYNVEIKDDAVIYNKVNMPLFGAQTVAEVYVSKDNYQEHKITKDLTKLTTVFFGAIPIDIVKTKDVKQDYNVWKLIQAPDLAWGETQIESGKKPKNDKEVDVQSPLSLAYAVEPADPEIAASIAHGAPAPDPGTLPAIKGPRLVVFGDADFATNEYIGNYPGNLDIFLNSITWLAQKDAQLGISAKAQDHRQAVIKPIQKRVIFWLTVFGMPAIGGVIGSIVWWKRRR